MAITAENWEHYLKAAEIYSTYRPRLATDTILVPMNGMVTLPEETFGVEWIDHGYRTASFAEFVSSPEDEKNWTFDGNTLYIGGAETNQQVVVIWRQFHQGDESTYSFPTIPQQDIRILDLLAQSLEYSAEDPTGAEQTVSSYQIGSTVVKYGSSSASGGISPSRNLYNRAIAMLDETIGEVA